MAAGDVTYDGDTILPGNYRMVWGTVVLDGGNPTPVALADYMLEVQVGLATIEGSTATGADPNQVTTAVSGTTLNIYAWKVTAGGAAGNPTEIASTDSARVIHWVAYGANK